jgi:hypothetical protein
LEPSEVADAVAAAYDEYGNALPHQVNWSSDAELVAAVSAAGQVRANAPGRAILSAQVDGLTSQLVVRVLDLVPHDPVVVLYFAPDVLEAWRRGLPRAAEAWNRLFAGPLPPTQFQPTSECPWLSDTLGASPHQLPIYVRGDSTMPSGVAAVGGRCSIRDGGYVSRAGYIIINTSVSWDEVQARGVGAHELGHTLGLVGYIDGHGTDFFDPARLRWTGFWGRLGYFIDTGLRNEVPYTSTLHWASNIVDPLGRGLNPGWPPISRTSAGALLDMGYPVAFRGTGIPIQ